MAPAMIMEKQAINPKGTSFFSSLLQVPAQKDNGDKAEDTQEIFADVISKFDAKGHSVVLNEMEDKPIFENDNFASGSQMGFDPDF